MMMLMKSVFWWRKPEYPEETTDLRQGTDETFDTYGLDLPSPGIEPGPQRCEAKWAIDGDDWNCQLVDGDDFRMELSLVVIVL